MSEGNARMAFGWRIYGVSVVAIALIALAFGDFDPGHPLPKTFPARATLAYAEALFLLVVGAASQ